MTRIAIVGGGIAGLSAAHLLSDFTDTQVTVFEAAEQFGGRADVTADGEHCPRLVLEDYHSFLTLLRDIPTQQGHSVYSSLKPVQRLALTSNQGWVEISHLYSPLAREVPLRDKLSVQKARMSTLVAERQLLTNANTYASRHNYTAATVFRMVKNLVVSRRVMAFPGATDQCLVDPWVSYLRTRGVVLNAGRSVQSLSSRAGRIHVLLGDRHQVFDAVIVATYIPDTIALLHASRVHNRLPNLIHTHCRTATIELDPREPVLRSSSPRLYCLHGVNVLLQPDAARCVVLCTKSASTEDHFILAAVRTCLRLEHDIVKFRSRDNSAENESVFAADYVRLDRAVPQRPKNVYFAGSYLKNSYPLDSAEGATRSALNACRELLRDFSLQREGISTEEGGASRGIYALDTA